MQLLFISRSGDWQLWHERYEVKKRSVKLLAFSTKVRSKTWKYMYVLTPPTYKVQKHQHMCPVKHQSPLKGKKRVKGNYPGNQRHYLYPFENYPLRKLITFTLKGNSSQYPYPQGKKSHYLYPFKITLSGKFLPFTLTFTFYPEGKM
jgi:hypothetical protein